MMKAINVSIIISVFIFGIECRAKAQTLHKTENKIEVEHKVKEEIAPVKEPEIKTEPHVEVTKPVEHAEFVPEKQPEVKKEAQPANPVSENNEAPPQVPAAQKPPAPAFNQMTKPIMKRAAIKPLAVDSTKR